MTCDFGYRGTDLVVLLLRFGRPNVVATGFLPSKWSIIIISISLSLIVIEWSSFQSRYHSRLNLRFIQLICHHCFSSFFIGDIRWDWDFPHRGTNYVNILTLILSVSLGGKVVATIPSRLRFTFLTEITQITCIDAEIPGQLLSARVQQATFLSSWGGSAIWENKDSRKYIFFSRNYWRYVLLYEWCRKLSRGSPRYPS